MWTELVTALPGPSVFQPPASEASLLRCATALGHPLPADLVALLRESNGIEGEYGEGLIWSAERIASENTTLRGDEELATLYMLFDPLLFFADAGNGDLFAPPLGCAAPMSVSRTGHRPLAGPSSMARPIPDRHRLDYRMILFLTFEASPDDRVAYHITGIKARALSLEAISHPSLIVPIYSRVR
ncbi:SMI1/KNR4 family protein [Streptomyces sp. NPDC001816]|uniref:SMI1/KNR4 family protein n=1 Tax=Streptomyces sp. NPDC001816 TaxID=3364612 RepID=UPI00367DE379